MDTVITTDNNTSFRRNACITLIRTYDDPKVLEIVTDINNMDIPDLQIIRFLFPLITDNTMS